MGTRVTKKDTTGQRVIVRNLHTGKLEDIPYKKIIRKMTLGEVGKYMFVTRAYPLSRIRRQKHFRM